MRVLHVLPSGGMGWSGGIRPTLRSLAESDLGERHRFEVTGQDDLGEAIDSWNPDLLAWHVAASWRSLPRLLRQRRRPLLFFEHHYCAGFERHNVPSLGRFRAMLRLSYGCASRVVAVSRGQYGWMEAARLRAPARLRLLRSSRRLDEFLRLPLPDPPPPGAPLRLLACGRFTAQKGFDRLIRALARLPEAPLQLQLVGDGPDRGALEQLARGDGRIRFAGARADIPLLLAECDAVVIPSRWEPWGNVCLEARAAGRPVVVSDVDGLSEQVLDCGLLVPAEQREERAEAALADALATLLASPVELRQRWSRQARRSAGDSWPEYVAGWSQLLAEFR